MFTRKIGHGLSCWGQEAEHEATLAAEQRAHEQEARAEQERQARLAIERRAAMLREKLRSLVTVNEQIAQMTAANARALLNVQPQVNGSDNRLLALLPWLPSSWLGKEFPNGIGLWGDVRS